MRFWTPLEWSFQNFDCMESSIFGQSPISSQRNRLNITVNPKRNIFKVSYLVVVWDYLVLSQVSVTCWYFKLHASVSPISRPKEHHRKELQSSNWNIGWSLLECCFCKEIKTSGEWQLKVLWGPGYRVSIENLMWYSSPDPTHSYKKC